MNSQNDLKNTIKSTTNHFNIPSVRYGVIYLLISISSQISSSLINSSSEYRFPYPILSTIIHLFLAFFLLTLFKLALHLYPPSKVTLRSHGIFQISPAANEYLRNPFLITASISSTLATLSQMHQSLTSTPDFTAFTKYLPLLVVSVGGLVRSQARKRAMIGLACWAVFVNGEGVDARGSRGEWGCAVGWSMGVVAWVVLVRKAMRESATIRKSENRSKSGIDTSRSPFNPILPLISTHLILSLLFLLPPLLLSDELPRVIKYNHLVSYSTEAGFWVQEIGVAGCGLLNLFGFYKILEIFDSTTAVFLLVSIKNFLLPYAFAYLLENPLDNPTSSAHALLSMTQQTLLLSLLGAVEYVGIGGKRGKRKGENLDERAIFEVEEGGVDELEGKYTRDEEKGRKAS